jgi:tetratricopeptide (TPR) repeat protein
VSEENDEADNGPASAGISPAASALALIGASRAEADAFLRDQRQMLHLQMEELREENPLKLSHLRLRRFSGWARAMLEACVGILLLAVVAGLGVMVWTAAHSDGLVIESFSVPPDMAAKGFTGQVIASKTLDELTLIQNANRTARAAKSFANNWGDDLKVEIPDTGVSVGEAFRFLKSWLGHETHISGEITRAPSGIAITARVGGESGATVTGSEADLDALVHKAAENIYRVTQPYRYGVYLSTRGRNDEAVIVFKTLATSGPVQERPWGYIGWANALMDTAPRDEGNALLQKALALQSDNILALNNLTNGNVAGGREQEALGLNTKLRAALNGGTSATINPAQLASLRKQAEGVRAQLLGDRQQAARRVQESMALGAANVSSGSYVLATQDARGHALADARAALIDPVKSTNMVPGNEAFNAAMARMEVMAEAGDWVGLLTEARTLDPLMRRYPGIRVSYRTRSVPLIAQAQARLGNFSTVETLIAPTPGDCGPCLRARGWIAALHGEPTRADFWFARAAAIAPSIPFAHAEWGKALLARGKPDAAIEKFKLANQKGPHFADPLEGWGEALMAKNQSHLALAKFAQAEKYAPNWGRLHLKWGQALAYSGKRDEARAQFARAATLDLTPSEKSELLSIH